MAGRHRAKLGRPTSYNDKMAEKICSLIAEGSSLRSICKRNEMPDKATVKPLLKRFPSGSSWIKIS